MADDAQSRRHPARDTDRTRQIDGVWYFNSNSATRKSRIAPPIHGASSASQPTRSTSLSGQRRACDRRYSAPSAGPPPWHVYRIKPATVYAFGTAEPGGATKFVVGGDD
jgi:hypothetical protein